MDKPLIAVLLTIFLLPTVIAAQSGDLRIYIDCSSCDMNFIRQEMNYVDHVRDQALADVQLLISRMGNASGGDSYELSYAGRNAFDKMDYELTLAVPPTATNDEVRKRLLQRIELGLTPYAMQTGMADDMAIQVGKDEVEERQAPAADPWRNWVFEVYGEGELEKESSRNSFDLEAGAELDRVTEDWRIRIKLETNYTENRFSSQEQEFVSARQHHYAKASMVRSLGSHWSAGIFGGARHSTFSNLAFSYDVRPAVEYNFYPYREVLRREITLAYKVGFLRNRYIEKTIYGKTEEQLFHQSLDFEVRFRQPWGDISSSLEASAFLHDLSKNRLELDSYVAVRIFKGLAVRVSGEVELIRDQLSLPAGDASIEDILLRQRQIATDFEMEVGIGLSYVFGSTFNNIVNTRL